MNFLEKEYLQQLLNKSKSNINKHFQAKNTNFTDFDSINVYLLSRVLYEIPNNLLITIPDKEKLNAFVSPAILVALLRSININYENSNRLQIGDIIANPGTGKMFTVRVKTEEKILVLPLGTISRVELSNDKGHVLLASKYYSKIREITAKLKSIKTFEKKLTEAFQIYRPLYRYFNTKKLSVPIKYMIKVVVVASKSEVISQIPECIPYQYINKNGEISINTMFEPLLTLVNDFKTVKECLIEKNVAIDTILFIRDSKFEQSLTAIRKSYRQQEFVHAIFIGMQDFETGDEFNLYKWNWTLPEVKFFNQEPYQNINLEMVQANELSNEIKRFKDLIKKTEEKFENLISLKRLLPFVNKIFPITALYNEVRIRERVNEILEDFMHKAEETFQDEYLKIDEDHENDFEQVKNVYTSILNLVKTDNKKLAWFATTHYIDFIVVPNRFKQYWEKELKDYSLKKNNEIKVKHFENLMEVIERKRSETTQYNWLNDVKIISVSDFFKREKDDNIYFFPSAYGNGIYPDVLLQKLLLSNQNVQMLCYEEEAMILKYFLQEFQRMDNLKLRSKQREQLCGLKYPEFPVITNQNIDEWLKFSIQPDDEKFSNRDEVKYHIYFEGETISFAERASKMIYIEGQEENFKEVRELSKGDRVRIYRPPSNELLHELIQMTDESKFFERVNLYSKRWKNLLKEYYQSKFFNYDFKSLNAELKENKLSVDETTSRKWLEADTKTKFPKRRVDIVAILKTVGRTELINEFLKIMNEYYGELPKRGNQLRDEIDNYLITGEIGKMLNCLGKGEIEELINKFAPLKVVKETKRIDEFID